MSRTTQTTKLEKLTQRLSLKVRGAAYFNTLEEGLHIGYRRTQRGGGTWVARHGGRAGYVHHPIGTADDLQAADGKSILTFSQAKEAARVWWKLEQRKALGLLPDTGPYTVAQALNDYFAERELAGSKGIKAARSAAALRIAPALGNQIVDTLTPKKIRDWLQALASSGKLSRTPQFTSGKRREAKIDGNDEDAIRARRATANRILTILTAALNFAFREERVHSDGAWRKVQPFHNVDQPVVRWMANVESVRLVNACPADFRAIVRGALMTGCRYGELCRLTIADFNAAVGTITVRLSKSGKPRHVALNDEGRAFFAAHTAGKVGLDLIFVRDDGEAWGPSHQQRPIEAASQRAAIQPAATFHVLRHTYGSALAMKGVPLGVIAAQLGHSSIKITERHYAHLCPSFVADTVRAALPGMGIYEPAGNVVALRAGA